MHVSISGPSKAGQVSNVVYMRLLLLARFCPWLCSRWELVVKLKRPWLGQRDIPVLKLKCSWPWQNSFFLYLVCLGALPVAAHCHSLLLSCSSWRRVSAWQHGDSSPSKVHSGEHLSTLKATDKDEHPRITEGPYGCLHHPGHPHLSFVAFALFPGLSEGPLWTSNNREGSRGPTCVPHLLASTYSVICSSLPNPSTSFALQYLSVSCIERKL